MRITSYPPSCVSVQPQDLPYLCFEIASTIQIEGVRTLSGELSKSSFDWHWHELTNFDRVPQSMSYSQTIPTNDSKTLHLPIISRQIKHWVFDTEIKRYSRTLCFYCDTTVQTMSAMWHV